MLLVLLFILTWVVLFNLLFSINSQNTDSFNLNTNAMRKCYKVFQKTERPAALTTARASKIQTQSWLIVCSFVRNLLRKTSIRKPNEYSLNFLFCSKLDVHSMTPSCSGWHWRHHGATPAIINATRAWCSRIRTRSVNRLQSTGRLTPWRVARRCIRAEFTEHSCIKRVRWDSAPCPITSVKSRCPI